jgi:subtilisin family serine protease
MFTIRLILLFVVCNGIRLTAQTATPIPNQYNVLIKQALVAPVCLSEITTDDREETAAMNESARNAALQIVQSVAESAGVEPEQIVAYYVDAVVGFTATLTTAQLEQLSKNPSVETVTPDAEFAASLPDDLKITPPENGQVTTCAVQNAGGFADGSAKQTSIWILDTGIDLDHPDLNVTTNPTLARSFIPGQGVDDAHGHGTHVAGIAAAKNNNFGVVGVSAGANLIPVKVLANNGYGSWSQLLQGLNHVAKYDKPNDVVNLSTGGYPINNCENSDVMIRNAIRNLGQSGTYVCIAAGNQSGNAALSRPGCINGTRVFTVGALDCNLKCASYSNWAASVVDWVATGTNVYSTYKNGTYTTLSGTSMAAPVVAGIVHARANPPLSGGSAPCGNPLFPSKRAKRI